MKISACIVASALAALPQIARAQSASPAGQLQAPAAAQACAACHGARGEGNPGSGVPRIAGQSQYYIAKQLESYVNGSRRSPVMEPVAKGLLPDIRAAVAAYYAQTNPPPAQMKGSGDAASERGGLLAMKGDAAGRVQACINCHGPGGVGEPPAMPYLAGLDADYIVAAINSWKNGTRRNDAGQQMAMIARAMRPEDVTAVAQYYASLPPPLPAPLNLVQAPSSKRKPVPGTTPSAPQATGGASGVGVEQGTTAGGGTEGEGGSDASKGAPTTEPRAPGPKDAPKPPATRGSGASSTPGETRGPRTERPGLGTGTAPKGDAARGRAIIASGTHGCAACHAIPGIRWPQGVVGPPLDGFAQRAFIAGELPNKPDVLVAFLQDPPRLVPKTGMPNVGLRVEEARHIAAFLYSRPADAR
jgi:cytochrome c553